MCHISPCVILPHVSYKPMSYHCISCCPILHQIVYCKKKHRPDVPHYSVLHIISCSILPQIYYTEQKHIRYAKLSQLYVTYYIMCLFVLCAILPYLPKKPLSYYNLFRCAILLQIFYFNNKHRPDVPHNPMCLIILCVICTPYVIIPHFVLPHIIQTILF